MTNGPEAAFFLPGVFSSKGTLISLLNFKIDSLSSPLSSLYLDIIWITGSCNTRDKNGSFAYNQFILHEFSDNRGCIAGISFQH